MSLPTPTRSFGFAPYLPYWQGADDWKTVRQFSNSMHLWPTLSFGPGAAMIGKTRAAFDAAVRDKKRVHYCIDVKNYPDLTLSLLKVAKPYWPIISLLEMADEPMFTVARTQAEVAKLKAQCVSLGLPFDLRKVGIVYTQKRWPAFSGLAVATGWIGLEAYVDSPGGTPAQNDAALRAYLVPAMAAVPADKGIVLVGQSYLHNRGRDGQPNWKNPATIVPMLRSVYRSAVADKRVLAMNCFSWLRDTGAKQNPVIADAVRACGMACLGA